MKLTKTKLKQLIKEELENTIQEKQIINENRGTLSNRQYRALQELVEQLQTNKMMKCAKALDNLLTTDGLFPVDTQEIAKRRAIRK